MADSDFENIQPADIKINAGKSPPEVETAAASPALGAGETREYDDYQRRNTRILWGIFGILLFLVLGVLFVLPEIVDPADLRTPASEIASPASTPRVTTPISPYEEAQRLEQREDAQNTLAALLEIQDSLEDMQVEAWAAEDFSAAVEQARLGDEAYREQSFLLAQDHYQRGLDLLNGIDNRSGQVFENFMNEGERAILDGNAAVAEESFSLAMAIRPESTAADTGLARAQVLEDVLDRMNAGLELHETNQLEPARDAYRQALEIDPEHEATAGHLARVNQDITDRNFSAMMTRGYSALSTGNPEQGLEAFEQALGIKPESSEAQTAIAQAQDQISSTRINNHLSVAYTHEEAERWADAVTAFNEALSIDPNVVPAVDGLNKARSRLNLDTFLEATIEDPLRLADDGVYRQTVDVFNNALRIPDPGPRLQSQLEQVRGFIDKAREPVPVSLRSDGITSVTVYRVGELGQFTSQTLNLIPGAYTAVGVREGYRDVRQEFVVAFEGQPPVVTIACEEQVL